MKEKISITLSKDTLAAVDRLTGAGHSRSAIIERILRRYFREEARAKANARDLERISKAADALNAEAADVLGYQSGECY